jgi:hypothetical protein
MPKGVADPAGARQLARVYRQLKDETQPGYLQAGGWAAAEVALGCAYLSPASRLNALHSAQQVWERALAVQTHWEQNGLSQNVGRMHRLALDLAILPLLKGVVAGNVTESACRQAFTDCLGVAESNMQYLQAARARGDHSAAAAHAGIAYECNALLAHNRKLSSTWFVIPAMARCDSGYYHWRETHDLLVVHQKYGQLISITPVEIKAKASLRDRRRYKALLVRGKMHLSVPGKSQPEHTLHAISAMYTGSASQEDIRIANAATDRFSGMIRDYYAGTVLGDVATAGSVTVFHDNKQVRDRHPGLGVVLAA